MPQSWQKPLIASHLAECQNYLEEARLTGDLDLLEEMAAKMCDVLLVYRRGQQEQSEPATFRFSDGVTRKLIEMAASHAEHEMSCEMDQDDEFPAWMERGERGT